MLKIISYSPLDDIKKFFRFYFLEKCLENEEVLTFFGNIFKIIIKFIGNNSGTREDIYL